MSEVEDAPPINEEDPQPVEHNEEEKGSETMPTEDPSEVNDQTAEEKAEETVVDSGKEPSEPAIEESLHENTMEKDHPENSNTSNEDNSESTLNELETKDDEPELNTETKEESTESTNATDVEVDQTNEESVAGSAEKSETVEDVHIPESKDDEAEIDTMNYKEEEPEKNETPNESTPAEPENTENIHTESHDEDINTSTMDEIQHDDAEPSPKSKVNVNAEHFKADENDNQNDTLKTLNDSTIIEEEQEFHDHHERHDDDEIQEDEQDTALNMQWIFGMNKDILGGMHNLGDDYRKEVFYVAGNIGIIYKYDTKEQILLQGHTNGITCCAVSNDKKWIVTADSGNENMIVVWDSFKGIPVKTIFDPHIHGVESIDISCDSFFLYSLSKPSPEGEQEISVWEWTEEIEGAVSTSTAPEGDKQTIIRCHHSDPNIFLTNGPKTVLFWEHTSGSLEYFPNTLKSDFKQSSSEIVQTTFVTNTTMAASGTTDGEIILWEKKIYPDREAKETEKEAMKVVKIHPGYSVNYITCTGPYIVSGGSDGFVKFLDHKLRIEAWFEEFDLGPIISISFEKTKEKSTIYEDEKISSEEFYCPDFIIQTKAAFIAKAKSSAFNNYDVDGMRGRIIAISQNESIQSLAVHPTKPYLAISGVSGNIHIWDYHMKEVVKVSILKGLSISCLAFDPRGEYLAVGCTNGNVKFFDAVLFTEIVHVAYRPSKACLQSLKFSHDSLFLAFSDSENCVGVFKFMPNPQKKGVGNNEWMYLGRFKSHKRAITGLEFGVEPYGDIPRLMSISEDRRLIEYDLENSSIQGGLKVKTIHRISQEAIPTAFLWYKENNVIETYPNEKTYFDGLLFANDQYKITSFITPNGNIDTRCSRTILSPTYGGPLNSLQLVPNIDTSSGAPVYHDPKYLVYSTHEKVIGMIGLPLNGNPKHHMGLIAHSGEITSCVVSPDGKYLFTAGGSDYSVNQWRINGSAIDKIKEVDEGIAPYISLIDGGEQGEFFQEVQQYFYYAQIRSQGEITTSERKITGSVSIAQIPDLVRSLGYYATQWEIQNMINELRVIKGVSDETLTQDARRKSIAKKEQEVFIDFNIFVKLYVNHRPVFGIQRKDIEDAFLKLGSEPITGFINKADLFNQLKTMGEIMTDTELDECLCKLLKDNVTAASLEERFTSVEFAEKLLGFAEEGVEQ